MKYRYLHIIPDNKFIGAFVNNLKMSGDISCHQFLAFNRYNPCATNFTYLDFDGVEFAPPGTQKFSSLAPDLRKYEKIFIHWLLPELEAFVRSIPSGPIVYWCFWGEFDAGFSIFSRRLRYEKSSFEYARAADILWRLSSTQKRRLPWLNGGARKIVSFIPKLSMLLGRLMAISRVDVLLHWNEIDHALLKKISLHPSLRYREFFYDVIDSTAASRSSFVDDLWLQHQLEGKQVIMLGHSAFPSGNHLEALALLSSKADDGDIRVVAVMSYGDPIYREVVIEKGKSLFGERFIAITKFLPIEEYYYLTNLVSVAIFNHRFSEGAGNIFRLMLDGKPIYLNPRSTIYQMLHAKDLAVFNIYSDLSRESLGPLSLAQVDSNKMYIRDKFSTTKSISNINNIFSD